MKLSSIHWKPQSLTTAEVPSVVDVLDNKLLFCVELSVRFHQKILCFEKLFQEKLRGFHFHFDVVIIQKCEEFPEPIEEFPFFLHCYLFYVFLINQSPPCQRKYRNATAHSVFLSSRVTILGFLDRGFAIFL